MSDTIQISQMLTRCSITLKNVYITMKRFYKVNIQENVQFTLKDKATENAKVMIEEHIDVFKKENDYDDFREALTHMFFNDFKSWIAEEGTK